MRHLPLKTVRVKSPYFAEGVLKNESALEVLDDDPLKKPSLRPLKPKITIKTKEE